MDRRDFVIKTAAALLAAPFIDVATVTAEPPKHLLSAMEMLSGKSIDAEILGETVSFKLLTGPRAESYIVGWTSHINGKQYGAVVVCEEDVVSKPESLLEVIGLMTDHAKICITQIKDIPLP
jgi:hypothetical protein